MPIPPDSSRRLGLRQSRKSPCVEFAGCWCHRHGGRSSGPGARLAEADGFQPVSFEAAVTTAELVIMALPDEVHGSVWAELEVHVPHACSVGFLHGFSIHHKRLAPRADLGVILVAPKGPGPTLRNRFVKGQGIPALVGVHQTGEADAELHLRRWGTGIGCTRAALISSSFAEECETDLFGEQAILCGGILALMRASFETLQDAGYSDEVAYIECIHELKQVVDLLYAQGPAAMHKAISNTAEFGAFVAAERLDSRTSRPTPRSPPRHPKWRLRPTLCRRCRSWASLVQRQEVNPRQPCH